MTTENQSLILTQSETTIVRFTITDAAGLALDITGAAFRWGYATAIGTTPVIEKTGPDFTIVDGPAGSLDLTLMAADLVLAGTYAHELEMTLTGKVEIVARGSFLIRPRILPAV